MNPESSAKSLPAMPAVGAHIATPRNGYEHHGIYVGNGRVVHYGGLCRSRIHASPIEEVSLSTFEAGNGWYTVPYTTQPFSSHDIVRRARSRVGENHYHLIHNNCEHFCTWCISGQAVSQQVSHYQRIVERMLCVVGLASMAGGLLLVA